WGRVSGSSRSISPSRRLSNRCVDCWPAPRRAATRPPLSPGAPGSPSSDTCGRVPRSTSERDLPGDGLPGPMTGLTRGRERQADAAGVRADVHGRRRLSRPSTDQVRERRRAIMPTFDTPGPIAATVVVGGAQVRVTARDRTDTVVLVEPINKASQSDVKVANKTKVDFAGGQLSVKTTVSGDKNGSVVITIDLPAGSSLVAYLAHSRVHADGSFGECELHMASGRVQLDRINALQANIAAGEVTIGQIAERATIDGAAFAMRISEVKDTVKLSSSGGQTWIGHGLADLDLSSGSGGFDIDRADGSVTATTGDGAIRIGRLTRGQAEL